MENLSRKSAKSISAADSTSTSSAVTTSLHSNSSSCMLGETKQQQQPVGKVNEAYECNKNRKKSAGNSKKPSDGLDSEMLQQETTTEIKPSSKQLLYRKRSSHLNQSLNETDLSINMKANKSETSRAGRRNVQKKVKKKNNNPHFPLYFMGYLI